MVAYIVITAVYLLLTQFAAFRNRVYEQAFLEGRQTTIEELIQEAEDSCQPFSVFANEKEVVLINTACLLSADDEELTQPNPVRPEGEP